jgi:hypothetical protein
MVWFQIRIYFVFLSVYTHNMCQSEALVPLCAHLSLPGTHQCDSRISATPAAAFQVWWSPQSHRFCCRHPGAVVAMRVHKPCPSHTPTRRNHISYVRGPWWPPEKGGVFTCSMSNPSLRKDQIQQTSDIAMEMWGGIFLLRKQPIFQHVSVGVTSLCCFSGENMPVHILLRDGRGDVNHVRARSVHVDFLSSRWVRCVG